MVGAAAGARAAPAGTTARLEARARPDRAASRTDGAGADEALRDDKTVAGKGAKRSGVERGALNELYVTPAHIWFYIPTVYTGIVV